MATYLHYVFVLFYCQHVVIGIINLDKCMSLDTILETQCGISNTYAWYTGEIYKDGVWYDKSGNCRNIEPQNFIGTPVNTTKRVNGYKYVSGTTNSHVRFPQDILPPTYTFMHLARYDEGVKGNIFSSKDAYFISGFYTGKAGQAGHGSASTWNFITPNSQDQFGYAWVLSTDQRQLYRSNGIGRTSSTTSATNLYRLQINMGLGATVSDWGVAEIIVWDYELTPKEYKCAETVIVTKYNIELNESPCPTTDNSMTTTCGLANAYAHYTGESFDVGTRTWQDISGGCRNVDTEYITNTLTKRSGTSGLNGNAYVTGTTSTQISWPFEILPQDYTFIHVAKYDSLAPGAMIFDAKDSNFASGFYNAYAGVALRAGSYITPSSDIHGVDWVISTDQRNLYRSNGIRRNDIWTTDLSPYRLGVNRYSGQPSDFAIAEILVFDFTMTPDKYKCIENALSTKYGNIISSPTACTARSLPTDPLYQQCAISDIHAWYTGETYDATSNIWHDQSGNCRNIESNFIDPSGLNSANTLNGYRIMGGESSTRIRFPYDVLPDGDYTFIHLTRHSNATKRGRMYNGPAGIDFRSGFYHSVAGTCYHTDAYVADNMDFHGLGWVLSTDQRNLYRSNGVARMDSVTSGSTTSASRTMSTTHYRLAINPLTTYGYYWPNGAIYTDFEIAEILVWNRKLTPLEYKCVETYLSTKYQITISTDVSTDCRNETTICGKNPFGWFNGDSYDIFTRQWFDISGQCRNIDPAYISSNIVVDIANNLNGQTVLTGGTSTQIQFPFEILPQTYTFFHLTRYNPVATPFHRNIFHALSPNFVSGFYNGNAGVCRHVAYLTPSNVDHYGTTWVLSTDQRNLYRSNGIKRNIYPITDTQLYRLGINRQQYTGYAQTSDFQVAEIMVFDEELDSTTYKCIEKEIAIKYGGLGGIIEAISCYNSTLENICGLGDAFAHYTGDSYDTSNGHWTDISGHCRNVENNFIQGIVTKHSGGLNGESFVSGAVSTEIAFPFEILPLSYTFFHVSRFYGTTKSRIFVAQNSDFASGFVDGNSGAAKHSAVYISTNTNLHDNNWVLSTDQHDMYRSNGVDRTIANTPLNDNLNTRYILGINKDSTPAYMNVGLSDWAIAEIIIYDSVLSSIEFKCVEKYLADKYNIPLPTNTKPVSTNPTTSPSSQPTNAPTLPSDSPTTDSPTTTSPTTDLPTTYSPTSGPTTYLPSVTPTLHPSNIPTPLPSDTPTSLPTPLPTSLPTPYPTVSVSGASSNSSGTTSISLDILLLILLIILVIGMILMCLYFMKRNKDERQYREKQIEMQMNAIRVEQINSQSNNADMVSSLNQTSAVGGEFRKDPNQDDDDEIQNAYSFEKVVSTDHDDNDPMS